MRVARVIGTIARRGRSLALVRPSRPTFPTGRVAVLVWSYVATAVILVVWLASTVPVSGAIALPFSVAGIDPVALGVVIWIAVGLTTSARGSADEGRVAIVFGVAPIVAAFALGGPTAAVWVALLGSFEARELRGEVPWYGVLANHAMIVIPAGIGGIVTLGLRGILPAEGSQLLDFLAVMSGATVFCMINVSLAVLTVVVRTGKRPSETLGIPWLTLVTMMAAESALAWVFASAYVAVAWWSPAALVIADAAASTSIDRSRANWLLRHHQLTQLPNRLSLTEHATDLRRANVSGACVFYIDLDGFKAINDTYDHEVGDDVLREIGRRLSASKRDDDFLAHLHGDEFVLVSNGIQGDADAQAVIARIVHAVEQPIDHSVGTIRVSASAGYRILAEATDVDEALRHADRGMALAKQTRARVHGRDRRRSVADA